MSNNEGSPTDKKDSLTETWLQRVLFTILGCILAVELYFAIWLVALIYDVKTQPTRSEAAHGCIVSERSLTERRTRYGVRSVIHNIVVACDEWYVTLRGRDSCMVFKSDKIRAECENETLDLTEIVIGQSLECSQAVRDLPVSGYVGYPVGLTGHVTLGKTCRK